MLSVRNKGDVDGPVVFLKSGKIVLKILIWGREVVKEYIYSVYIVYCILYIVSFIYYTIA